MFWVPNQLQSFWHVKPLSVSEWDFVHLRLTRKKQVVTRCMCGQPRYYHNYNDFQPVTPTMASIPSNQPFDLGYSLELTRLSNSSSSVLWSSVLCNGSSEKQPRPGPQNTHKGQGPKDTLRVIAVSAVCQRWSPGLIGGALIALPIKPSVSVQRSVSCLFACFCCSNTNPSGTNSSTDVLQASFNV